MRNTLCTYDKEALASESHSWRVSSGVEFVGATGKINGIKDKIKTRNANNSIRSFYITYILSWGCECVGWGCGGVREWTVLDPQLSVVLVHKGQIPSTTR